jgi:hypothetical protein
VINLEKLKSLDEIETGDLILTSGRGIYARGIQWFTESKYNHVAIALDSNLLIEAKWHVEINPIKDYNEFDVYRLKSGLSDMEKQKMRNYLIQMHGTDYDVFQIFGYIVQALFGGENMFNNPKNVICSELGDYAYSILGYDILPEVRKGDITPDQTAESELFGLVYSYM